jgi:hypothetical protein
MLEGEPITVVNVVVPKLKSARRVWTIRGGVLGNASPHMSIDHLLRARSEWQDGSAGVLQLQALVERDLSPIPSGLWDLGAASARLPAAPDADGRARKGSWVESVHGKSACISNK